MHSQNNEEKIIKEYFDKYFPNQRGTVLDIGANDGETLSNSRYLISELGWSGYLVEAAKSPYLKLEALYQGVENVNIFNVALGVQNMDLTFYESGNLLNQGDVGLVSSLVPSEIDRWKNSGVPYTEYPVKCFDWKTFKSTYSSNVKFDFISIDIEGMDYDVLTQIDLKAHGCKCLCVEWNGKDKEKYVAYAELHDLYLIDTNPENLIFAKVWS